MSVDTNRFCLQNRHLLLKTEKLGNREILNVDPKGIELLAQEALKDVSFMLRTAHLEKLKLILDKKAIHHQ